MFYGTKTLQFGQFPSQISFDVAVAELFRGGSQHSIYNLSYMFHETNLTGLNVSGLNTSNATVMSSMFESSTIDGCLDLRHFDASRVKDMFSMFQKSESKSIDLSCFDTANVSTCLICLLNVARDI